MSSATGPPGPRSRLRRRLLRVLPVVTGAAAAWGLWAVWRSPDRVDLATYWALVVAVAAFFVTLVPLWRSARGATDRRREDRTQDELARVVLAQWESAVGERGLRDPLVLPVRWELDALRAAPVDSAVASTEFPPIPGCAPVDGDRLRRGGAVRDLHDVYGGLASGRLLITGAPGSGKTTAAMLLVVAALRHRAQVAAPDRPKVPVPVLLPVAGWDPGVRSLYDWVVAQLQRTYEEMFAGRRGAASARRLLADRRIAIVLDGLDEMPAALGRSALVGLDRGSAVRTVVTVRDVELGMMIEPMVLPGAVAVALQPVEADTAADYLAGLGPDDPGSPWADLVGQVRCAPGDPLARALQRPLMLSLIRDGLHDPTDVAALVDLCSRRPAVTTQVLEDHLLGRLVETAYRSRPPDPPPRYDVDTALHTLRWVAVRMGERRELAWWQLPAWAPRLPRAVVVGVLTGLVTFGLDLTGLFARVDWFLRGSLLALAAVGGMLGAWCAASLQTGQPVRWRSALRRPGVAFGQGVAVGCVSWGGLFRILDEDAIELVVVAVVVGGAALVGLSVLARRSRRRGPARLGVGVALVGGVATGWVVVSVVQQFGDVGYLVTTLAGALLSVVLAFRLALAGPSGSSSTVPLPPLESWRRGRGAELVGWLVLAAPCGVLTLLVVIVLMKGASAPPDTASAAFGLAVLSGAALGLVFPESWLVSFAAVQLALRHRPPVHLMRFLDDARARGVLRTVGSDYQFRHADFQDWLVRSAPVPPARHGTDVERKALVWIRGQACQGGADDQPCRFAWWHIPGWAPATPRIATVGVAGGVLVWLGLDLAYRTLWLNLVGAGVAAAAAAGAATGAAVRDKRLRAPQARPVSWASAFRRPVALGVALGLAFAVDLSIIPPDVALLLSFGLISGALFWLLLGAALAVSRGAAGEHWGKLTADIPVLFALLLGVDLGYLAMQVALWFMPFAVEFALHLVMSLVVCALGLWVGASDLVPSGGESPTTDPFLSWRRHRPAQLAVWLVGGMLVGGFVLRSWIRVVNAPVGGGQLVVLGALLVLALVWGAVLGLLFPATWLTSVACLQLRFGEGVPRRLMQLLDDARRRGTVRVAGPLFELVPSVDAPSPAAGSASTRVAT